MAKIYYNRIHAGVLSVEDFDANPKIPQDVKDAVHEMLDAKGE